MDKSINYLLLFVYIETVYRNGERQMEYDRIYKNYRAMIYKFINESKVRYSDLDDCFNHVFIYIVERIGKYDKSKGAESTYIGWLIRGGINDFIFQHYSNTNSKKEYSFCDFENSNGEEDDDDGLVSIVEDRLSEDQFEQVDDRLILEQAIDCLVSKIGYENVFDVNGELKKVSRFRAKTIGRKIMKDTYEFMDKD